MKKPNSLHGRVASSASDNTRRQHRFQVSSRGLLACGCSIRHSVFDKSSLTHHLLQSGKKMRFSCMAQAMLACQQVISRDYHLLPRMILARIRPGEVSPGYMEYDTRLNWIGTRKGPERRIPARTYREPCWMFNDKTIHDEKTILFTFNLHDLGMYVGYDAV